MTAYQELIDIIAKANPTEIANISFSGETLQRVEELLLKNNEGTITKEELKELDNFLWIENLLGLAKARAMELLKAA